MAVDLSNPLQLSLSTRDQFFVDGSAPDLGDESVIAAIAADPADGTKQVAAFEVNKDDGSGTSERFFSVEPIVFTDPVNAISLDFKHRYTHGAAGALARMRVIRGFASDDTELFVLGHLAPSGVLTTRFTAFTDAGGATQFVNADTAVPKDQWSRYRLRWTKEGGFGMQVDSQTEVTNTTDQTRQCSYITIGMTADVNAIGAGSGDKFSYFRDLRIEADGEQVSYDLPGGYITLEQAASPESGSTITQRLRLWIDMANLGTGINDASLVAQFRVREQGETEWDNSGSAEDVSAAITADTESEAIVYHDVTGLTPGTAYEFSAVVSNGSGEVLTTGTVSGTAALSADAGTPRSFKLGISSCTHQSASGQPLMYPYPFPAAMLTQGIDLFVSPDDMIYPDEIVPSSMGALTTDATIRQAARLQFFWNRNFNSIFTSMPRIVMPGDHWFGVDNYFGVDGTVALSMGDRTIAGEAEDMHETYLKPAIIHSLDGTDYGGYIKTAKTLIIFADDRSNKNKSFGSRTLYGSTQKAAIEALLDANDKPIVLFINGATLLQGHGPGPEPGSDSGDADTFEPDGANQYQEYLDERDDIFQAFADGANNGEAILIPITGDRHRPYVATDWENDYGGRVKPEWQCSPGAFRIRNLLDDQTTSYLDPNVSDIKYIIPLEEANAVRAHVWGVAEVNEASRTVTMRLYRMDLDDGSTIELFTRTYRAGASLRSRHFLLLLGD